MLHTVLANTGRSFWMPERASTVAKDIDHLFDFVLWINVFFFILIAVLTVAFVIRYRHREGRSVSSAAGHSNTLELTWTVIPTILVLVVFYYGFVGYMDLTVEPPNSYEITANGQMWNWQFTYPNGHVDKELHVPKGRNVRVVLTSGDVIHSLFVPAFRVKKDVVPGRYNRMWFTATDVGSYDIYCAEYCGTQHSVMRSTAVVHEPADFNSWLEKVTEAENNLNPVDAGRKIYETRGCKTCHTIDGTRLVGPSLRNAYGATAPLADGTSVLADDAYIRESIQYPQAKVHAGFQPVMTPYLNVLKDKDINNVIAFLKSISTNYKGDPKELMGVSATQPATRDVPPPVNTVRPPQ